MPTMIFDEDIDYNLNFISTMAVPEAQSTLLCRSTSASAVSNASDSWKKYAESNARRGRHGAAFK